MEINGFEIDKFNHLGFEINKTKGKTTSTCVHCSHKRSTTAHRKQKCVMIDLDVGIYTCQHCGISGQLHKFKKKSKQKKKYKKPPPWKNVTKIPDAVVKYFEDERCISQITLENSKVTAGRVGMPPDFGRKVPSIFFNYFKNGELINIKYRTRDKGFRSYGGAELILYNYDWIISSKECCITEGEIDALSYIDAGYPYTVSVPNGATLKKVNLDYIDSAIEEGIFDKKDKIYISVDNDEPGINLRDELVRRLGAHRCYKVVVGDCKDANQFYIENTRKWGKGTAKEKLLKCLSEAKLFPIDGVIEMDDIEEDLDTMYIDGLPKGYPLPFKGLNVNIELCRVLTLTGIPSHGKTAVVHQILAYVTLVYKWKIGVFSPESYPPKLYYALSIQILIGCDFTSKYINKDDYKTAKNHLKEYYSFIYPKEDFLLDSILNAAKQLVYRKGIRVLVLDAFNNIEHDYGKFERGDIMIERFYMKLHRFAKENSVFIILVAHPLKMGKNAKGLYDVPTAYDIKGGAPHYDKADFIICPYRHFVGTGGKKPYTEIIVQKVKFKHLGQVGSADFRFNPFTSRYTPLEEKDDKRNWLKEPPENVEKIEDDGQIMDDDEDILIENDEPIPF